MNWDSNWVLSAECVCVCKDLKKYSKYKFFFLLWEKRQKIQTTKILFEKNKTLNGVKIVWSLDQSVVFMYAPPCWSSITIVLTPVCRLWKHKRRTTSEAMKRSQADLTSSGSDRYNNQWGYWLRSDVQSLLRLIQWGNVFLLSLWLHSTM